jgi:hypothetical protein
MSEGKTYALNNAPRFVPVACGYIGHLDEAKSAISDARQIDPTASLSKWVELAMMPQQNLELFLEGWRKAGLPE